MSKDVELYLSSHEGDIKITSAPYIADNVWQQHKKKKQLKVFSFSTAFLLICFSFNILLNPFGDPQEDIFSKNLMLEHELIQVSFRPLTSHQEMIMKNWYSELAQLDMYIELQTVHNEREKMWPRRFELLTQMVDFYNKPVDFQQI